MRSIITILSLFYLSTAFAQKTPKHVSIADAEFNALFFKSPKPVISGNIINASKEELSELKITYSLVDPFLSMQTNGVANINEDGSFKFTLEYPFPYQEMWINLGDYFYAAVYANSDIELELDLAQLKKHNVSYNGKGIKYKGEDGAFTNWRNNLILYKRKQQLDISDSINKLNYKQKDYVAKLDSLYKIQFSIDSAFFSKHPSGFKALAENDRLCDYYLHLIIYMQLNNIVLPIWEKIKIHKGLLVSNSASQFNYMLYHYANYKAQQQSKKLNKLMGVTYADVLRLKASNSDVKANEKELREILSTVQTPWVKVVLQTSTMYR